MRHNTRQNPVSQLCPQVEILIQESELVKQKRFIPRSGLSPISTDFIRPTGRPSKYSTGSARAEPSTPWSSPRARSGKVGDCLRVY